MPIFVNKYLMSDIITPSNEKYFEKREGEKSRNHYEEARESRLMFGLS